MKFLSSETQEQAACKGMWLEPDFFRKESQGETTHAFAERADRELKSICAECAIRVACREYALEHNIDTGVWGGLLPNERRDLRRRRVNRAV